MDEVLGDQIQGSISGTMMHGTSLVQGKTGNAFFTDGINQHVDNGIHENQCFYNPDVCTTGVTFALWLKALNNANTFFAIEMGGSDYDSRGLYLKIQSNQNIKLSMKWDLKYDYYRAPNFPLLTWVHVALTWERAGGIRLFINGCDADVNNDKGHSTRVPRSHQRTITNRFVFGAGKNTTAGFGKMTLDEFIAWHDVLEPEQIWELFRQGGTINQVA